ncbi:MAG: ABC transporter ATP-binding protein [Candidatus Heimdallarchaeaceae archaeon]
MTEIQLYHVTKVFGKKIVAVDDVSLTIEDGEYVTLIGPSGCGKTTTLRLIAGTILPTKGKIYFDNVSMENMPIQERHIGFVFQHFAVFPHMTVRENVAYGPTVRGKSKKEIEYLTESALKSVGLSDRAEVYPKELSAPELQQTALARVLASESRILLLDEPIGALDQAIRESFQHFLRSLVKREGLTAIHVTHDQGEALSISDRVAVMNRGQLIQIGAPEDLLYSPIHIFTSFFVGESDFIEGIVIDDKGPQAKVKVGQEIINVHNAGINKGARVVVAVRREFYNLIAEKQVKTLSYKPTNILHGRVVDDRFLGILRRVRVKLVNQQIIEAKIHAKHPYHFKQGEKVLVNLDPRLTRCYRYPKEGIEEALRM